VAMANFLPWGSQNFNTFLSELNTVDSALLIRVLDFADELNEDIVKGLRPRLLVIPVSLARNKHVADRPFSLWCAKDIRTTEGRVTFYTGMCERGMSSIATTYVRHPSSLHLKVPSRRDVANKMASVLSRFVKSGS